MRSKLLFFDLAVCSVWMLSIFGQRTGWTSVSFLVVALVFVLRLVVSFSLYGRERRSYLPLLMFFAFTALMVLREYDCGINTIAGYSFVLMQQKYSMVLRKIIEMLWALWLFVFPLAYYLFLLSRRQLERTALTWKDMLGGILWHDRLAKTVSVVFMVVLTAFLVGLSMDSRLCQLMCITASPLVYKLVCRYKKVEADSMWLLVVGMCIFWYAQLTACAWRVLMLIVSMGFVVYVGIRFYRNTRNSLLAFFMVVFLSVLLPSMSIGYNQYACMNYARKSFYYLSPFQGILYITDDMGKLGLRDRYGVLIEPEYESICKSDKEITGWRYVFLLQKGDSNRYYDVFNNVYIDVSDMQQ